MQQVKIDKVTIHIGVGQSGDLLNKASKVLEQLTGQIAVKSQARLTIRSFGIRRNEDIAVYVTVRGSKAEEILNRALRVKDFELRKHNFAQNGGFGFGVQEHIDLGIKYDPNIGIFGLDVYVTLKRPGMNKKKHAQGKIGHEVSTKDVMHYFVQECGGAILA